MLTKYPDYGRVKAIAETLQGNASAKPAVCSSPSEIKAFKFAPITSVDVERSFSKSKNILSDRRQAFTVDNLKMVVVLNCNKKSEDDR